MLFGLLSGIRSARSPLIVGYVVLASLWILLYHLVPESSTSARTDYPEIDGILSILGPVGAVAALSFAAYLIGDLVVRESAELFGVRGWRLIEESTSTSQQLLRRVISVSPDNEMELIEDLVSRTMIGGSRGIDLDDLRQQLATRISTGRHRGLGDFDVVHPSSHASVDRSLDQQVRVEVKGGRIEERILTKNPELYGELSRLRGEAEFRSGLLPAVALLYLAVAFHVPWAWSVLALIAFGVVVFEYLTLMEVARLRGRARGIVLGAVLDGLVSTPTLEAIERESEALRREAHGPVR